MDQLTEKVIEPRRKEHAEQTATRRAEREELARLGTADCPFIDKIDPALLGVGPSELTDQLDERGLAEYVTRDIDAALDAAFASSGTRSLIVVAGHPKTGKTRTLYEAARRLDSPRRVFALRAPDKDDYRPAERLAELSDQLGEPASLLVWIDDVHEHFDRGLTRCCGR